MIRYRLLSFDSKVSRRLPRGVGRGSLPNPKPDVQVSLHPAFQTFLDSGNASALGRIPPQSLADTKHSSLHRLENDGRTVCVNQGRSTFG